MSEESSKTANKKKQGRSPAYPALSLEQAVDKAKTLYDKEGRTSVPLALINQAWGYAPNSGPANLAVSAIKKYGLLVDSGSGPQRKGQLTDAALSILHNPSPEVRGSLLKEAALRPAIHRSLWEQHHGELPSNDALRYELVFERNFTESGAREFMLQFRRTVAYAQLEPTDTLTEVDEGDGDEVSLPIVSSRPVEEAALTSSMTSHSQFPAAPQAAMPGRTIPILLGGGQEVQIAGVFPISSEAWEQFLAVLQAMKPGLVEHGE